MRNVPVWERIIPLSFDSRSNFDKERERVIIYPKVSDIVMIEGDDNYSTIYFTSSYQKLLGNVSSSGHLRLAKTLKYFEDNLKGYGCFFRCSRGAIINLYHVRLLKYRTIYLHSVERAVFLSGDLVSPFKEAMVRVAA